MKVTGEGRIRESITRKRQASSLASVGSTCGLNLKIPGEQSHTELLRGAAFSHLETNAPVPNTSSSLQETGSRWFPLRRG